MHIGAGIVHAVGVLPLRRTARAQVAVTRRGKRFAKPLSPGIEAVVGEQETVHGTSSPVRDGHTAALAVRHGAALSSGTDPQRGTTTPGPGRSGSGSATGLPGVTAPALRLVHSYEASALKVYPLCSFSTRAPAQALPEPADLVGAVGGCPVSSSNRIAREKSARRRDSRGVQPAAVRHDDDKTCARLNGCG